MILNLFIVISIIQNQVFLIKIHSNRTEYTGISRVSVALPQVVSQAHDTLSDKMATNFNY